MIFHTKYFSGDHSCGESVHCVPLRHDWNNTHNIRGLSITSLLPLHVSCGAHSLNKLSIFQECCIENVCRKVYPILSAWGRIRDSEEQEASAQSAAHARHSTWPRDPRTNPEVRTLVSSRPEAGAGVADWAQRSFRNVNEECFRVYLYLYLWLYSL